MRVEERHRLLQGAHQHNSAAQGQVCGGTLTWGKATLVLWPGGVRRKGVRSAGKDAAEDVTGRRRARGIIEHKARRVGPQKVARERGRHRCGRTGRVMAGRWSACAQSV